MAKSFRRFREDQHEDEWSDDNEFKSKDRKMKERKEKQRQKNNEKMASYEASEE